MLNGRKLIATFMGEKKKDKTPTGKVFNCLSALMSLLSQGSSEKIANFKQWHNETYTYHWHKQGNFPESGTETIEWVLIAFTLRADFPGFPGWFQFLHDLSLI